MFMRVKGNLTLEAPMRALFLTGLVLSIIALSATADETKLAATADETKPAATAVGAKPAANGFTLLEKKPEAQAVGGGPATRGVPDYSQGVPVAEAQQAEKEAKCRVRKTVEAGVAMGGVSGTYGAARLDYGKDDKALARGYAPNPCPDTGFAMSLAVSGSDMEVKRRSNGGDRLRLDADQRPDLMDR